MSAVWYRARADLRRSWITVATLSLVVAIVGGLVIASVAGASRSRSSLDRLVEMMQPPDGIVFAEEESISRLGEAPEVGDLSRLRMFAMFPTAVDPDEVFLPMVASLDGRVPSEINRPRVIEGRLPRRTQAHEVALRERTARLLGVELGGRVEFASLTAAETEELNATGSAASYTGPTFALEVVGIVRDAADVVSRETDISLHYLTPAFAEKYDGKIGVFGSAAFVSAAPGKTTTDLAQAVSRSAPDAMLEPAPGTAGGVQTTLDVIANGLQLFAGVLAFAGLVVLSQTLARVSSARAGDETILAAMGLRRSHRVVSAAMPGIVAAVVGMVGAPLIAFALSPLFPIGVARRAEPQPGFHFDATTVLVGTVVLGVVVSAAALVSTRLVARQRGDRASAPRRSQALSRAALPAAAEAGLLLASPHSRNDVPIRSTRAAVGMASLGVVAALVFAASLSHLVDTPRLYGWGFDAGLDGTENNPEGLAEGVDLDTDPAVAETAPGVFQIALRIEGKPVYGMAVGFGRDGTIGPVVASGRPPEGDDEVALGRDTLEQLGVSIGDVVSIDAGSGAKRFRIVGQAVIPVNADGNTTIGAGAAMTVLGSERLGFGYGEGTCEYDESCYIQTAVRWAPGTDVEETARRILADGELSAFGTPTPPGEVARLTEVEQVPWLLAAILGVLAVLATAHTVAITVRRRRRDLGILRTVGFTAKQMKTAVSVQAAAVVVVSAVLGAVLGIVVGRAVWSFVANGIGVRVEPAVPWLVCLVPVGVFLLSQAIALVPARRAGRVRPASVLRTE